MPKFSIITVCKNVGHDIEWTLQSVLSQTYTDYEYIVIDGASTDQTCQIIRRYSKHVTKFVSEPDIGIYDAMNKGINLAQGEYLFFLNAGDRFLHENILTIVANQIIKNPVDIFFGHILILNMQSGTAWTNEQSPYFNKLLLLTNQPMHQATFIRRDAFIRFGFYDTCFRIVGDYDWFLRAFLRYHCTYQYFDFVCSVFVRGGLCNTMDPKIRNINMQERILVINKHYGFLMRCVYKINFLYKFLFYLNILWRKILRKTLKLSR